MADIHGVEIYAGAGGLSSGLSAAGIRIQVAVEADRNASNTYASNHRDCVVLNELIHRKWSLLERLDDLVDLPDCHILVGGPPCQGWSSLGSRGNDARRARFNAAISHFLRQVELVRPAAVLLENVSGLAVRDRGRHVRDIESRLKKNSYNCWTKLLRAADYGVPQLRKRLFIIAIRDDLNLEYEFPKPTYSKDKWLTVWDAIGDLPSIAAGSAKQSYTKKPRTALQKLLRGNCVKLTRHESPDHSSRMLRVLRALKGDGSSRGQVVKKIKLTSGFHNTYCRLSKYAPAPAITGSAGRVSSGRNAHPVDDRALTPREAARLQTFPDSYKWCGERWPVYLQIGNAVPPLLAKAVAEPLVRLLQTVV
jgi:DNA (cytosine-5)-methyltransferase 1